MTDLVELLETAQPSSGAAPPTVADLRSVLAQRHRRRRRRQMVSSGVAALALTTTIGLAVRASRPTGESLFATIDPTPAGGISPAAGAEAEWSALLPTEEWRPVSLRSAPIRADELTPGRRLWVADPAQGPYGPVAAISFNAGVDTIEYADGPSQYDDVPLADGRTARIGTTDGAELLDVIAVVDGGSIHVAALGIGRDELLDLVAGVAVDDGVVEVSPDALPAGLGLVQPPTIDGGLQTSMVLRNSEGAELRVELAPLHDWSPVLAARSVSPDSEVIDDELGHLVIYPASATNDAGAVLVTEDTIYDFGGGPLLLPEDAGADVGEVDDELVDSPDIGAPGTRPTDMGTVLPSLGTWTATDLIEELDLQPRQEVVGGWLADTPLPPDADLDWLAEGPPLSPELEVAGVHLWLACSWVDSWVASGDPSDLLALGQEANWPTGRLLDAKVGTSADGVRVIDSPFAHATSESTRAASSAEARADSDLRQNCSEPLGNH